MRCPVGCGRSLRGRVRRYGPNAIEHESYAEARVTIILFDEWRAGVSTVGRTYAGRLTPELVGLFEGAGA